MISFQHQSASHLSSLTAEMNLNFLIWLSKDFAKRKKIPTLIFVRIWRQQNQPWNRQSSRKTLPINMGNNSSLLCLYALVTSKNMRISYYAKKRGRDIENFFWFCQQDWWRNCKKRLFCKRKNPTKKLEIPYHQSIENFKKILFLQVCF